MEQNTEKLDSDSLSEQGFPPKRDRLVDWEGRKKEGLKFFVLLVAASVFGFIGGVTAPSFSKMLREQSKIFSQGGSKEEGGKSGDM